MPQKILITGASGLIGTRLTELLLAGGYSVVHLGRVKKMTHVQPFVWDVEKNEIDLEAIGETDAIIHLAGAGIADERWTASRKKEIVESRTRSTGLLLDALKKEKHSVKSFISASAIGYYGFGEDEVFVEESNSGSDFLAQVTKQWEGEVNKVSSLGIRLVKLRIGVVLSSQGGALEKMTKPVRFGLGSPLGSGKQYLSWIHIDDLCALFIKAIEDEKVVGTYNAVADWTTNAEMTKTIASVLKRPLWLPNVPSFILKVILGEMADIVLKGSKVSSQKILRTGFQFKYPALMEALENLFNKL